MAGWQGFAILFELQAVAPLARNGNAGQILLFHVGLYSLNLERRRKRGICKSASCGGGITTACSICSSPIANLQPVRIKPMGEVHHTKPPRHAQSHSVGTAILCPHSGGSNVTMSLRGLRKLRSSRVPVGAGSAQ